jgi:hypothetical protein
MRNRRSGCVADDGSGYGANRPKHHRARQSAERGVTCSVLRKYR